MTRTTLLTVAAGSLLLLGACGGSDTPRASEDPTPTATTATSTPTPTPSADTATATAPPTTAGPTDELLDYGDDGVTLTTAADVKKLKGAPQDFKAFVAKELAKDQAATDEACTEKPTINVTKIDTGGWAAGGHFIPQCGGNATLWARPGGTWKEVWGGQQLVDCATLTKYSFPADIVGGTCLKGDQEVPYTAGGVDAE